jgi:nitrite reductase/ring-hydroxylating ferredoxin subunit
MNRQDREQLTIPPDGRADSEQPQWRQDFPIDWPNDHYVARRDFTKFLVLTSLAFAVGQLWIAVQNFFRRRRGEPPVQFVARPDQIPADGTLTFTYPGQHDQCVIVRTGENQFTAFSRQCTHLSCSVVPEPDNRRFFCPCHEGAFDIATGDAIAGPPRRPLARITLEVKQGAIYAVGVEFRTI